MGYKQRIFSFLAISFIWADTSAQNLELGLMGGGAGYIGDLNQTNNFKLSGIAAGAFVKLNLDPYWALGLHYNFGKIKGDDLDSDNEQFRNRGLNFSTALNEVTVQVDFNFLEYFAGGGPKQITPYLYTGLGGVFFSPRATYVHPETDRAETFRLRFYRTEGQSQPYRNYALTVPYGAGVKVRLKENWGLFSQIGYRTAYTDYLDDVGNRYADPANWPADDSIQLRATRNLLSNPSGSADGLPGRQRGDFRKRDTYMFVGIGISYTFVSQKCYTF